MKVPFGLHEETNRYVGIDEAENGLACKCICPSCEMQLKARQGKENEHHFAHHKLAQVECEYSYWVAVRSMAKQIMIEKGVICNFSKMKLFSSIPWTRNAPLIVRKLIIDPHIKEYQFDAKIDSSFGEYYIYLLTSTDEDSGRTRGHYSNQPHNNTFSPYLVLEVDLQTVKKYNNKASEYLRTLLSELHSNKEWFSTHSSYLEFLEQQRIKKEQQILLEKSRQKSRDRYLQARKNHASVNEINKQIYNPNDDAAIIAGRMIRFFWYMHDTYNLKDKLSENLTIAYKGKNLWYVSCCHEFFCVSLQETYIVYNVLEENVYRLASSFTFNGLDYSLKQYIVERDGIL